MHFNRLLNTITWLTLGLCACSADDALLEDVDVDPEAPEAEASETAELRWRYCGESAGRDLFCTELEVPLDYDEPEGDALPIAMNRVLANPDEPYRGVLFLNPGGPGGSGKQFALALHQLGVFDAIAPGFDVIGFDPRGVAESGARSCGPVPEPSVSPADMASEMGAAPDAGMQALVDIIAAEGARCERHWGPLFRELGSKHVVRDMDAMREALGEEKLNFLGISYGTRLGALYAHTFPQTAGSIVLDAPVHPRISFLEDMRIEFGETLRLHEAVFADCEAGRLQCPPEPRAVFEEMIADADALGIAGDVLSVWRDALAQAGDREILATLLALEATQSDPAWLFEVAELADSSGIGFVVNFSVNCTDAPLEPPSVPELDALHAEFMAQNPHFAWTAMSAAACAGWPTTRDPIPLLSAPDAPPLLVIGGTHDLRTPFVYAEAMTEALGNATLLTSNHYGHGATPLLEECVTGAVRSFLIDQTLPPPGATCL